MIVAFTGTRRGMTRYQHECLFQSLTMLRDEIFAAQHGDCIGSDAQFHTICLAFGIQVEIHPCNIPGLRAHCQHSVAESRPKPPLERNRVLVDTSEVLIAAPFEAEEVLRSGTWATIRYARKIGRRIIHLHPTVRVVTAVPT